jgi:ankyrin repeat protein
VAKLIIDVGIGLNLIPQRTEEPRTPLMTAVLNGSVEALEVLLTKVIPKDINQLGVDLHFETTKNQTALDVAILYGQSETALVVIESMVKYTTYLNEQEGVEYNQKNL